MKTKMNTDKNTTLDEALDEIIVCINDSIQENINLLSDIDPDDSVATWLEWNSDYILRPYTDHGLWKNIVKKVVAIINIVITAANDYFNDELPPYEVITDPDDSKPSAFVIYSHGEQDIQFKIHAINSGLGSRGIMIPIYALEIGDPPLFTPIVFNETNLKDNVDNIIVNVAHAMLICCGIDDDAIVMVAVDFIQHIKQYMFNTKLLSWEKTNKQRTDEYDEEDKENVD
jgi:hypothetical protein